LFADEHVDDASAAKNSLHYDAAGAMISYVADLRSTLPVRM
jgi:hypothetical protein